MDQTSELIKGFESYRSKAYWDVNAWRVGYGSDTTTDADCKVHKVTKDTVTTRDAADRDLARRIPVYQAQIKAQVGQAAWDGLNDEAKAAVTSVAYNYGGLSGLRSLRNAIKSGDSDAISKAILARGDDNSGINKDRRTAEASLVAGHPIPKADVGVGALGQKMVAGAVPPPPPRARPEPTLRQQLHGAKPLPAPTPLKPGDIAGKAVTSATKAVPNSKVRVVSVTPAGKIIPEPTILGARDVAGKAAGSAAVKTILGGASGVTKTAAPTLDRKLPNPTSREAQAEQVAARKAAATPAAKAIVPTLNRSAEQVAQDEQNAMLTGYRGVQDGTIKGPNASKTMDVKTLQAGSKVTGSAAPTPALKSGAQKSVTVNVSPSGSTKSVQQAGTVAMPSQAKPGTAIKNVSGSPDDRQAAKPKTVTYEQPNPEYTKWEKLYGTGGANSALQDIHDKRDDALSPVSGIAAAGLKLAAGASAGIPKAPPKTISVTRTYTVEESRAAATARANAARAAAAASAANRAAIQARAAGQAKPAPAPVDKLQQLVLAAQRNGETYDRSRDPSFNPNGGANGGSLAGF